MWQNVCYSASGEEGGGEGSGQTPHAERQKSQINLNQDGLFLWYIKDYGEGGYFYPPWLESI